MFEELFKELLSIDDNIENIKVQPVQENLVIFSDIYNVTEKAKLPDNAFDNLVFECNGITTRETVYPYSYSSHFIPASHSHEFVQRLNTLEK